MKKNIFNFTSQKLAYRAMLKNGGQINSIEKIDFWLKELIRDTPEDEYWVLKLIFFIGSNNWFIEDWVSNEAVNRNLWSPESYNLINKINSYY
jgi:hypothetical protein